MPTRRIQFAIHGSVLPISCIPAVRASYMMPMARRPAISNTKWANRIGPLMDPDRNRSPSFGKLRDGLRRLAAQPSISRTKALSKPAPPR
jgi:hypothetical protein